MPKLSLRRSILFCMLLPACSLSAAALSGKVVPVTKIVPLIDQPKVSYSVPQAAATPMIDGNDREWQSIPEMTLTSQAEAPSGTAQDLAGSLRMMWGARGLYCCLTVTDDCFATPRPKEAWLGNDCIQFSFDPFMHEWSAYEGGMTPNYCFNLTKSSPTLFRYRTRGTLPESWEALPGIKIAVGEKSGSERVYEWLIPWQMIKPVSPWTFGRAGFTFAVNDCDEPGFQGGLAWTPGILGLRNSANFGQISFEGAVGSRSDVLSIPPEPVVTSSTAPSRWLNLEGVEPRQTARVLITSAQAGVVQVTMRAIRTDEKSPNTTATLERNVQAGETAAFVWDLKPLGEGNFTLNFDVTGVGDVTVQPQEYRYWDIEKLRQRLGEQRDKFGIDRPWDDMAKAPALVRRHRGMVAAAIRWLDPVSSMTDDARTSALYDAAEMISKLDRGVDYLSEQRTESWAAYYASADGSGQPFVVEFPKTYNPKHTYPLLINLHGYSGRPQPTRGWTSIAPGFEVLPWGRGDTGYSALGENDVLSIIDHMLKWYHIDPEKVYLTGESMGGSGTWRIATRHPDVFAAAAPMFGSGDGLPLENLCNLPVLNQHGLKDFLVPVDIDRFTITQMQQWGYPVMHMEYPEAGHGIRDRFALWDWLVTLRRNDGPTEVTYTCETPEQGGAYWLRTLRMVDPHRPATMRARVSGHGRGQFVTFSADNTALLDLDTRRMPIDRKSDLLVQAGTTLLVQPAPLPEHIYLHLEGTKWSLGPIESPAPALARPYRAGAAASLFTGEPMLIVYGTQGDAERTELYRKSAETLAVFPGSGRAALGGFPVKADSAVTQDDLSHYNLSIIGDAAHNSLTARMVKSLPFAVNENNELVAGTREPVSLDGAGIRLFYYNPLAPQRLIFLISTTAPTADAAKWLENPQSLLTGSNGRNRVDQADLVVQSIDGPVRRRMQFVDNWQWRVLPNADRRIAADKTGSRFFAEAAVRVTREQTGADIALGWGESPDSKLYDDKYFTWADLSIEQTPSEVLITTLSGADLREIDAAYGKSGDLAAFPALNASELDPERRYTVAMPPSLCWLFTGRSKNLDSVQVGPSWSQDALRSVVFAP